MSDEIENAYRYCENVTKIHAKSFYFATKFLPPEKRKCVYPIYAFCRHVDDAVDEAELSSEREIVEAVAEWQLILDDIYSKTENPKPKTENQNFVLTAWRDLLRKHKIPQKLPQELMRGVLMDTETNRYETFEDLYVYCFCVASTVGLMSSEILGYEKPETLLYAEALGIAMQLTNILRDVKEDAAMNRIYLPQEDLRRFGVSEEQIFAGKFDANFAELAKFQIARARSYYEKAEKGIPMLEPDARFCVLLAARLYARILDEIERQNYDVFLKRAHLNLPQKIFLMPKIWREAKKM